MYNYDGAAFGIVASRSEQEWIERRQKSNSCQFGNCFSAQVLSSLVAGHWVISHGSLLTLIHTESVRQLSSTKIPRKRYN